MTFPHSLVYHWILGLPLATAVRCEKCRDVNIDLAFIVSGLVSKETLVIDSCTQVLKGLRALVIRGAL